MSESELVTPMLQILHEGKSGQERFDRRLRTGRVVYTSSKRHKRFAHPKLVNIVVNQLPNSSKRLNGGPVLHLASWRIVYQPVAPSHARQRILLAMAELRESVRNPALNVIS